MIELGIETHDRQLGFEMAGQGDALTAGAVRDVGGARLQYQGTLVRKALGIPEVLQFLVDAAVNVDLGLLAAWLYDKVKGGRAERIVINRRVITEITPEHILQVLEEEIRRE